MATAVQKVLDLQKQFEEAKSAAIKELLDQRGQIDEQLKALGHGGGPKTTKTQRAVDPNRKCPVCSQIGHDGRFHKRTDAKKLELKK